MTVLLGCFALITAGAADTEEKTAAESTYDRWTTINDLEIEVDLMRPLEEPTTIRQGPGKLQLEGGYLVPVFSGRFAGQWEKDAKKILREQRDQGLEPRLPTGDERGSKQIVGWVWTGGTGTLTVALPDRADALLLANRMVRDLGADPAELTDLAHKKAPLTLQVFDATVLSVDPMLEEIFRGPENVDPYEVVVWADGKKARRAQARITEVWSTRESTREYLDIGGRIGWDRMDIEQGSPSLTGSITVVDTLTDTRFGLVAPQVGGDADKWVTVTRDATGSVDGRRAFRVASMGDRPAGGIADGLIGGLPHPPRDPADPTSGPRPTVRIDPVHADSTVLVTPTDDGLGLQVSVESRLTFRAAGAAISHFDMFVPKVDWAAGSFEVLWATLEDGTPLLGRPAIDLPPDLIPRQTPPRPRPQPVPRPRPEPDPTPDPPDEEDEVEPGDALLTILLPEPVPPGEELVILLKHVDSWPFANLFEAENIGMMDLGATSGMRDFLPIVSTETGAPWRYDARVGIPASSKLVAAVGGTNTHETEQDGWHLTHVTTGEVAAAWPTVAVGKYKRVDEPAQLGYPAVRTRLLSTHFGAIEEFAPEVRRVVNFYQRWLPDFPLDEVEIFESPNRPGGYVWVAPHGLVNVQQMLVTGVGAGRVPEQTSGTFAHELAHQYWGHMAIPATREDFWIAETFAELFSSMYIGAAFTPKHYEARVDYARRKWESTERPPEIDASLTRAYYMGRYQPDIVYRYGPLLFGHGLQSRIGTEAMFAALDRLLTEHPHEAVTTERLQQFLEQASGEDLQDWFDFWVYGGYGPELQATWHRSGKTVRGNVSCNVPFGTVDVPLRLSTKDGQVDVVVRVVDGVGGFEVTVPTGRGLNVTVDPDKRLVARKRAARQVKPGKG